MAQNHLSIKKIVKAKIAIAYLHALNPGSSKSHVKRERTGQRLEYIKAE